MVGRSSAQSAGELLSRKKIDMGYEVNGIWLEDGADDFLDRMCDEYDMTRGEYLKHIILENWKVEEPEEWPCEVRAGSSLDQVHKYAKEHPEIADALNHLVTGYRVYKREAALLRTRVDGLAGASADMIQALTQLYEDNGSDFDLERASKWKSQVFEHGWPHLNEQQRDALTDELPPQ